MSDSLARKLIANRPVVGQLTLASAPSVAGGTRRMKFQHALDLRQIDSILQGGVINWVKALSSGADERRSA